MPTQRALHNPWTKGEKFLLGAIVLTVALAALGSFWWRQINATPYVAVPTPVLPAQNAFGYFNAAAAAEVQRNSVAYAIASQHPPHPPLGSLDRPYSAREEAALVQANGPALKIFRQGLPLPYQNPPARSFSTFMPYYASFRGLARLLKLEGQVRAGRGDWGGAVGSHLDAVELGAKIPHGGTDIGLLVGIACESIGRRPLWAEVGHLSEVQTQAAIRRLEVIQKEQVPFADALQEQEWTMQASLLEILRHTTWRGELTANLLGENEDNSPAPTLQQLAQIRFTSKRAIMGDYTAAMDEYVRAARQPYTTPFPHPSSDLIVQEYIPDYSKFRLKATNNEVQNVLLLTALALRAYRLEHGAYPGTLARLSPAYLKQMPSDPFAANGPLHYKHQGINYVLYSVGPDGRDDGGRPIFDATKPAPQPGEHDQRYYVQSDSQGDIVAGVNY